MPDFGIFRGFNEKLFGDKLVAGQLPTQLGLIGSEDISALLLDSYPNAAAAYSLRKLRRAYTGDAIRVRRASDNTEQDIGFVNNELDTSTLTSFCSGTNGFVKTWYDQSGNGNDASQTTASNQPQIVSSGSTITENGKPSVQFDGSDDYVVTTNNLNFGTSKRAEFLVASSNPLITNTLYFYGLRTGTSGTNWSHTSETAIRVQGNIVFANSPHSSRSLATIELLGTDLLSLDLYLNGVSQTYTSISNVNIDSATAPLFIGYNDQSQYLDGKMQELILYSSDQSSNRTGIETNINDFYSIY